MMKQKQMISAAMMSLSAALAAGQEFNWLPCGVINVGDRASEARAGYESLGAVVVTELNYGDGISAPVTGRMVRGAESFVIRPASVRSGPAPADLVIVRRMDSQAAVLLRVAAGEKAIGTWEIEALPGARRWRDVMFVIPYGAWSEVAGFSGAVPVTIAADGEHLSAEYRFYSTRDWMVLAASSDATAREAYQSGLRAEGDHDWAAARAAYQRAASSADSELARLARLAMRRVAARAALNGLVAQTGGASFDAWYRLGMYAGAIGCWDVALAAYRAAVAAQPAHADATYRLAEAMQYNRYPAEEYAPLFERSGMLWKRAANHANVLLAVHVDAVKGMCAPLKLESLAALQRDWRIVEQLVYGASRGAYKLDTTWRFSKPGDPAWVMQTGWIFLPPHETVPLEGSFDYSIGSAEFGSSHAGGVDCGVSRSGGAQIGATRSWEVFLHEWNHEFDWVCVFGGQAPGYPTTHDSDGCGKQPIVNMGCGHQASMRYYITPGQYARHRPSDVRVIAAAVTDWRIGGLVAAPRAPKDAAALEAWLIENGYATNDELAGRKRDWEAARTRCADEATNPPVIASQGAPPVPDTWAAALHALWQETAWMDKLCAEEEEAIISGAHSLEHAVCAAGPGNARGMVEFTGVFGDAPDKCVAYARTLLVAPESQPARLWIGYNGRAQVWLNGRRIHHGVYRSCAQWDNKNQACMFAADAPLRAGTNVLVMKVERCAPGWGLNVHVVDNENRAIAGLQSNAGALSCGAQTPRPQAGLLYAWNDVADDWMERLPLLSNEDLARITGIAGLRCAEQRFHLLLPDGTPPLAGSRYCATADTHDCALNNYLNWDTEAVAALRFMRDGAARDLLVIRPEYIEEFMHLLRPGTPDSPRNTVRGYLFIKESDYGTTPNRTARAALVVETQLGEYPLDEMDVLSVQ